MTYSTTCSPCGRVFSGEDKEEVATRVIDHARTDHEHTLTRDHVMAHFDGLNPHEGEGADTPAS